MNLLIKQIDLQTNPESEGLDRCYLPSSDATAQEDAVLFGAYSSDKLCGLVTGHGDGRISSLSIHRDYDDRLAEKLMDRIVCALKLRGIDELFVLPDQVSTAFFLSYGFVPAKEEQVLDGKPYTKLLYRPLEIMDLYDREGRLTGLYAERGRRIDDGLYHLVVNVWKTDGKGRWLINRRALGRGSSSDGFWETTGGVAVAGDDSLGAALRETREELGIELDPAEGRLFKRLFRWREERGGWIQDVWVFPWAGELADLRFQLNETTDAMWADQTTIRQMIEEGRFLDGEFYPYFDEFMAEE